MQVVNGAIGKVEFAVGKAAVKDKKLYDRRGAKYLTEAFGKEEFRYNR